MCRLTTYRVSYRIAHVYHIDVDASSPQHAAAWAQTLLTRFGTALTGSKKLGCDVSVLGVKLAALELLTR
jgi:hypothetical protein